jgi:hypothetical protein
MDPTVASVKADTADPRVIHDPGVVYVMHHRDVYIVYRTVIEKLAVLPTSTFEAFAEVPESIVDPSIETNLRTPVSFSENKTATTPAPVSRGPEKADFRRQHPGARNPIIIAEVVIIGPVPGHPEVSCAGAKRLRIHGQCWRTDGYRYANLPVGCRR